MGDQSFESPLDVEEMYAALKDDVPLKWTRHESAYLGDYLKGVAPNGFQVRLVNADEARELTEGAPMTAAPGRHHYVAEVRTPSAAREDEGDEFSELIASRILPAVKAANVRDAS